MVGLLLLFITRVNFWFYTNKTKKLLMRVTHVLTWQLLYRLLAARATGSGGYNHDSAASFDSSQCPLLF
jgi:hypothetical protein